MRNIKLTIEYDGKAYLGWQRLGDSDKTIQGKIEKVLTKITGEEIEITGSGRTDAGTHARGQIANFGTNTMHGNTTKVVSLFVSASMAGSNGIHSQMAKLPGAMETNLRLKLSLLRDTVD